MKLSLVCFNSFVMHVVSLQLMFQTFISIVAHFTKLNQLNSTKLECWIQIHFQIDQKNHSTSRHDKWNLMRSCIWLENFGCSTYRLCITRAYPRTLLYLMPKTQFDFIKIVMLIIVMPIFVQQSSSTVSTVSTTFQTKIADIRGFLFYFYFLGKSLAAKWIYAILIISCCYRMTTLSFWSHTIVCMECRLIFSNL